MIYKSQCVHYKIAQLHVTYNVLYRIELLSIPYNVTKLYAAAFNNTIIVLCDPCLIYRSSTGLHNYIAQSDNINHMSADKIHRSELVLCLERVCQTHPFTCTGLEKRLHVYKGQILIGRNFGD